jgi:hypothetical protein
VRIFKSRWFDRFAENEGIGDKQLKDAVAEIEAGLVEANLGAGVFKKRIARAGEGKSGGYRTIVFFRSGERTFFQYGFSKSARDNINKKELRILKESAKLNLNFTDKQLKIRIDAGQWIEF